MIFPSISLSKFLFDIQAASPAKNNTVMDLEYMISYEYLKVYSIQR